MLDSSEPHQQGVSCHAQQQERSGRSEGRALGQLLLDVRAQGFQLEKAGERPGCIAQPWGRNTQVSTLMEGMRPSAAPCIGKPACRRAQAHATTDQAMPNSICQSQRSASQEGDCSQPTWHTGVSWNSQISCKAAPKHPKQSLWQKGLL